jgi:hypothetical protein
MSEDSLPSVRRTLTCGPEEVFAVLADGWVYPTWVVGASRMRKVDDHFPATGSQLHHSAGVWPALLDDTTSVMVWDPPRRMELQARGWPAGAAHVVIEVREVAAGCEVTLAEDVVKGPGVLVPRGARAALITWRNTESLRRLAYLAEGRARSD